MNLKRELGEGTNRRNFNKGTRSRTLAKELEEINLTTGREDGTWRRNLQNEPDEGT